MAKMYARDHIPRKTVVRMDPDCAICHAPASMACDCEAKGLEVAIKQAEHRMMQSIYNEIRTWVRAHAQDYILEYFRLLTERRKAAHMAHLDNISAHAYHYYQSPPHPNDIAAAQATLKRGIDEDWQASVQRYPEVLEYFFSLVELTLPSDDEAAVKDPPLSALNGSRKISRRSGGSGSPPEITGRSLQEREIPLPRRSPAPIEGRSDRRTPVPRERRASYRAPPPASYYPAPWGR